jgi:hypothetical protein
MPLIPDSYDGLVSAVKALAEDDSVEFENYIPTAIFLAEERLIKELDTQGVKTTTSVVGTGGNRFLTKPASYRFGYDVSFRTSSGNYSVLTKKTDDFIKDYWPIFTSTGRPKYYGDVDATSWLIGPTPASAYNYTILYTGQIAHLSAAGQTNYFTNFCADALFYGTMSGISEFMKDYTTQQVWEQKYGTAVQTLNNEGRRSRRDDGVAPNSTKPGQNTLRGDN